MCLGVVVSGLFVSNTLLYGWIWFNVFIAIYEVYIYAKRNALSTTHCSQDFWNTLIEAPDVPFRAWEECACVADHRYVDPDSYVYLFELLNVALAVTLCFAWFNNKYKLIRHSLIAQALVCIIYFITLYQKNSFTRRRLSIKHWSYWSISALWIIIPLALITYRQTI